MYHSKEAEFVVLYGRRRIGKTFLIRQFFKNKKVQFFQATGLQKGNHKKQLSHFTESLSQTFANNIPIKTPETWDEAFKLLTQFITSTTQKSKTIIFLDELPWMATRRAGLLESLDYYWNQHWSKNDKIILVVCGSSASWLINNIIHNKGGLHNRCTCEIKLDPFTLLETQAYLLSNGIRLNKTHILEIYMALGGVPYYLKYVENGLSAYENIQNIFFDNKSPLKDEFGKLFDSLFVEADAYVELIKLIAEKKEGLSRIVLKEKSKLSNGGGRMTKRLNQLEQTNFIQSYLPLNKQRGEYYKVVDEFCLFYLHWIADNYGKQFISNYWLRQIEKPRYEVWAGYAFESVCYKHIDQIVDALNIRSADTVSAWKLMTKNKNEHGVQIDLLIDRDDDAITLCEIKYTANPFVITKQYAEVLSRKIKVFKESTKTNKQIFFIIISANGIRQNQYSKKLLSGIVTLEDLFKEK